jgi:WD40 repeat protein
LFSTKNRRQRTVTDVGPVVVLDATTGRELRRLVPEHASLHTLAYTSEGRTIVAGGAVMVDGEARGRLIVWNLDGGDKPAQVVNHVKPIGSLAISPDDKQIAAVSSDGNLLHWELGSASKPRAMPNLGRPVRCVAFSPEGERLVMGIDDRVMVWNVKTRAIDRQWTLPEERGALRLALAHSGKVLATADADKSVDLWDVETGEQIAVLPGHTNRVQALVFSPDDAVLVTAGEDYTIKLWNVPQATEITTLKGHQRAVLGLSFSPTRPMFASASGDGTIKLWASKAHDPRQLVDVDQPRVLSVALVDNDQRLVAAGMSHDVALWDLARGRRVATLEGHTDVVRAVVGARSADWLATASEDCTIRIWDRTSTKQLKVIPAHDRVISTLTVSPDDRLLVSGSLDRTVKIWRMPEGELEPGESKLWDAASGHIRATFVGRSSPLAMTSDSNTLVVGSNSGTLLLLEAGDPPAADAAARTGQ